MKSIMISIRPEWCEKIANGEKIIEVRKTKPKFKTPFKCYIYCTSKKGRVFFDEFGIFYYSDEVAIADGKFVKAHKPFSELGKEVYNANKRIIGEFICDKIDIIENSSNDYEFYSKDTCLTKKDFINYCNGKNLYAWHISNLLIYSKPKKICEFMSMKNMGNCTITKEITKPPQSWCYLD